ncbi:MAG: TetR/AcrR family transcriptional regulator [Proteobacteria bacterium]|nr:TetR/AcrR family transcriptional regulator [Pseudomonadota bacterium]
MANGEERSPATSNRVLDAAVSCFQCAGIDKTTMSNIITESGLARTTVYRHFPIKDDIISRLVLRDIDHLIRYLDTIRARHETIEDQLLETLAFIICEIGNRPVLAELFSQDPIRLNRLGLSNQIVMAYTHEAIKPTYDLIKAGGRLRGNVSLEDFSEWCGRVIMSFVISPHRYRDKPSQMRSYIQNFILPSMLRGDK